MILISAWRTIQRKVRFSPGKSFCFILILLAGVLFHSCSSIGKIAVQTSVPPRYPLSEKIQSIAILNRSINPNFTNIGRDSLEKLLIKNDLFLDTVILDSVASDTSIQIAAKALFESDRFDVVVPKQRNILRKDTAGILPPLDQDYIKEICRDFNVNAVLVLENFIEKVKTELKSDRYYLGIESNRTVSAFTGVMDVSYNLTWRLYQPEFTPAVLRFDVRDTLFWDSFDYNIEVLYNKLPSLKEALILGGVASGTDMAGYISPKWSDEIRHYFITGKKEIDAAIPLLKDNKWKEAAGIWEKYASVSSENTRSKVEFNLALTAEMMGNLDQAIEWGIKSYKSKYTRRAESYLKYLDRRRDFIQKKLKK